MQLRDIAFKNLQRRKSKALFLVFGMVFGIATIVALFTLTSSMENSINKKIQDTGLKLAIVPKTDSVSFSVGGIPVVSSASYNVKDLKADAVNKIRSVTDAGKIRVVAPKVMGTTQVNGEKTLIVGVDFPSELKIKSWWELDGRRPEKAGQLLIGSSVANKFKAQVGSALTINNRPMTVSGVLKETGEDEDGIIFTDLNAAQNILSKQGKLSFVEITTVKDEQAAASLSSEIAKNLPDSRVKVVKEASEARQELVDRFSRFSYVVSFVMVIIAALIITTSMMASVNERTREIGIFRAIGFRQKHVTRILLIESTLVTGFSAVVGYLAGMGAARLAAPLFSGFKLVISWNPMLGLVILVGAIILGILGSIYPASKAAKLDPAEALRFI